MKKLQFYTLLALLFPAVAFTQIPENPGTGTTYAFLAETGPGLRNPYNPQNYSPFRFVPPQFTDRPLFHALFFGLDNLTGYQAALLPSQAFYRGEAWEHQPGPGKPFGWEKNTLSPAAQTAIALPFLVIGHDKIKNIRR